MPELAPQRARPTFMTVEQRDDHGRIRQEVIELDPAYRVILERRDRYFYALLQGERESLELARAGWQIIADQCRQHGYKKVLVEEDIPATLSFVDMYAFAAGLYELGFSGIQIAFVERYAEQFEDVKFAEDVAATRGIWGRVFDSVNEAEAWLLRA